MIARRPARASALVGRELREVDRMLADALPRVLAGGDEEAVHDFRVAIRRARTLLKAARSLYGRFHADFVRAAFTRVHRSTGALRDEEVLEETLDEVGGARAKGENGIKNGNGNGARQGHAKAHALDPHVAAFRARRRARERSLRRAVTRDLHTGSAKRARELLHALLLLPVRPSRDRPADKFARRVVERARKRVDLLRATPATDVTGLHELRIAYKELRYACELLANALPADIAAMAEPAARFQKRLGEIHDIDVAINVAERARALPNASRARLIASLRKIRTGRIAKLEADRNPMIAEDAAHISPEKSRVIVS